MIFRIYKLGELGKVSFGMLNTTVVVSKICIFLPSKCAYFCPHKITRNWGVKLHQATYTTVVVSQICIFLPSKCAYFCPHKITRNSGVNLHQATYTQASYYRCKNYKVLLIAKRHLVILYTRYAKLQCC